MIYESQKKKLKKYRHIIAALISYSIGYFTPLMALGTIEDYKKNKRIFASGTSILLANAVFVPTKIFSKSTARSSKARLNIATVGISNAVLPLWTEISKGTNHWGRVGFEEKNFQTRNFQRH